MRIILKKIISLSQKKHEFKLLKPVSANLSSSNRSYCNFHQNDTEVQGSAPAPAGETVEPLVDSFGRRHDYLRISLTERCNLRCQYCMPAEGVPLSARAELLSAEELARLVRVFARAGVRKARLTGGEPTLRADLPRVVAALRGAGLRVALTTNGVVLTRALPALQRAGLGALNVSLDSLRAERYARMARRAALPRVLAGVELALQLGYRPVKINVVLVRGFNDDEICDFVEWTRDRHLEVRFIEFMPFSGNQWDASRLVPYREALRAVFRQYPRLAPEPPRDNDTATVWRVPEYKGTVGFIHSMTQHFCSTCNRLRLTADGNLKVCLFGAAEVSLRDALRGGASDLQLDALVRAALANKKPSHAARRVSSLGSSARLLGAGARQVRAGARQYCSLTHLDEEGRARMVDVGDKAVTRRVAVAECRVLVSERLLELLRGAGVPKGDALCVAQVAGALAAKRTHHLLPLCHALALECARVQVLLPPRGRALRVRCEARVTGRTGAEMEALTGAAVAALALYDMCKSVDRALTITDLRVVHKSGGRSGDYTEPAPPPDSPPAAQEPRDPADPRA